jgi:hypothetical protein
MGPFEEIIRLLLDMNDDIGAILMGQTDINTQVQNIAAVTQEILTAVTNIVADLADQGVDTTSLDSGVAALQAAAQQLTAAVPVPPTSGDSGTSSGTPSDGGTLGGTPTVPGS